MNNVKYYILILIFLFAAKIFSQKNDTLNRLNEKGDKIGYWKMYYNINLESVMDTINAKYISFDYYINGKIFRYTREKKKEGKIKIVYIPKDTLRDNRKLNGVVSYYDSDKNLAYKDEYSQGLLIKASSYSYYFDKHYILYKEESIDYSRKYNNTENTYYHEVKDFKIFKDKWVSQKEYVLFTNKGTRKTIKM